MKRTLLVIDDTASVRESLRFLLLRQGYEVLVAENGMAGLALAAESVVDGAMVDIQMPGMDGIEVCRRLRAHAATTGRPIAVWMMTGARSPDLARLAREAGALELLGKPFDLPVLFRRLELHFRAVDEPPRREV